MESLPCIAFAVQNRRYNGDGNFRLRGRALRWPCQTHNHVKLETLL